MHRYSESILLCESNYSECVQLLGELHPITLGSIEGLAVVLEAVKDYERAMAMYRLSYEGMYIYVYMLTHTCMYAYTGNNSVLGKLHRSTIDSIRNIAYMLQVCVLDV